MWGHLLPVSLVQVLRDVLCVWVVFRVISNGLGPVVCGPDHLGPGHGCAGVESTSASKQINYSHDSPHPYASLLPPPRIMDCPLQQAHKLQRAGSVHLDGDVVSAMDCYDPNKSRVGVFGTEHFRLISRPDCTVVGHFHSPFRLSFSDCSLRARVISSSARTFQAS